MYRTLPPCTWNGKLRSQESDECIVVGWECKGNGRYLHAILAFFEHRRLKVFFQVLLEDDVREPPLEASLTLDDLVRAMRLMSLRREMLEEILLIAARRSSGSLRGMV